MSESYTCVSSAANAAGYPRPLDLWACLHDIRVVVGDAGLSKEGPMALRDADDPGLGDGDVVDAEQFLDLVGR